MAEMHAVVGYMPDEIAEAIGGQPDRPLEIKLERGSETHVRINPEDVAGVLVGASHKGETSVQVLLNEEATVETFTRGAASSFLRPIRDGNLFPWPRQPVNVIYVPPQLRDELVRLNERSAEFR